MSGYKSHAESGLKWMPRDFPEVSIVSCHEVEFPAACCPISGNPREGSRLLLRYRPSGRLLEVYSLRSVLRSFVGGYLGSPGGVYPPMRDMEGAVQLIAQMAADALGVAVTYRAVVILDTGTNTHSGRAKPKTYAGGN